MIRFACPSCAGEFTVGDEKAGKTGTCPKCSAQFIIPEAPAGSAPPPLSPPPPPPPAADGVEIRPCPKCQAKLSVDEADLGKEVECPYCKTAYKAKRAGSAPGASADGEEPPRKKRRFSDEDDDRERSRPRYDDDPYEEEGRPRRRSGSGGGSNALAIVSLIMGISSIPLACCCGLFSLGLSVPSAIMGAIALKNKDGRGMALAGLICSIVSAILVIGLLIFGMAFNVMNWNKMGNNPNNFNNPRPVRIR